MAQTPVGPGSWVRFYLKRADGTPRLVISEVVYVVVDHETDKAWAYTLHGPVESVAILEVRSRPTETEAADADAN